MSSYRNTPARVMAKKPLSFFVARERERRRNWSDLSQNEDVILKEARRERRHWKRRVKELDQLRVNWPKGKKKAQVILEHIAKHREGLLISEIRQWIFEKNGHEGKAYASYYVGMLTRDEVGDGKLRLLTGWCDQDPMTKRWTIRKGVKIEPPFFRYRPGTFVTAGDFRKIMNRQPYEFGVRVHPEDPECTHSLPDEHIIFNYQLDEKVCKKLGIMSYTQEYDTGRSPEQREKNLNAAAYNRYYCDWR